MRKKALLSVVAFTVAVLLAPAIALGQAFPTKTITDVVFSSAGGGTDVMNRQLAAIMEKSLGQKMIVTNMPGGLGGTAAEHVWSQAHDGYTVLGVSETASTFLVNAATKHGVKDWIFFIGAGSPGILAVRADSPIKTFQDLVAAAKKAPRAVKVANSGKGKLWHLKAVIVGEEHRGSSSCISPTTAPIRQSSPRFPARPTWSPPRCRRSRSTCVRARFGWWFSPRRSG